MEEFASDKTTETTTTQPDGTVIVRKEKSKVVFLKHEPRVYYGTNFPQVNDIVVVLITAVAEAGVTCELLEYGNIEGIILSTELTNRRIRSMAKEARIGQIQVVRVIRVDPIKGYIDLSKKGVREAEKETALRRYQRAQRVQQLFRTVADQFPTRDDVFAGFESHFLFPVYQNSDYVDAYQACQQLCLDHDSVAEFSAIDTETRGPLLKEIERRFTLPMQKVVARFELYSCSPNGIEDIQALIKRIKTKCTLCPYRIYYLKPDYQLESESEDPDLAMRCCKEALNCLRQWVDSEPMITYKIYTEPHLSTNADVIKEEKEEEKDDDTESEIVGMGSL